MLNPESNTYHFQSQEEAQQFDAWEVFAEDIRKESPWPRVSFDTKLKETVKNIDFDYDRYVDDMRDRGLYDDEIESTIIEFVPEINHKILGTISGQFEETVLNGQPLITLAVKGITTQKRLNEVLAHETKHQTDYAYNNVSESDISVDTVQEILTNLLEDPEFENATKEIRAVQRAIYRESVIEKRARAAEPRAVDIVQLENRFMGGPIARAYKIKRMAKMIAASTVACSAAFALSPERSVDQQAKPNIIITKSVR